MTGPPPEEKDEKKKNVLGGRNKTPTFSQMPNDESERDKRLKLRKEERNYTGGYLFDDDIEEVLEKRKSDRIQSADAVKKAMISPIAGDKKSKRDLIWEQKRRMRAQNQQKQLLIESDDGNTQQEQEEYENIFSKIGADKEENVYNHLPTGNTLKNSQQVKKMPIKQNSPAFEPAESVVSPTFEKNNFGNAKNPNRNSNNNENNNPSPNSNINANPSVENARFSGGPKGGPQEATSNNPNIQNNNNFIDRKQQMIKAFEQGTGFFDKIGEREPKKKIQQNLIQQQNTQAPFGVSQSVPPSQTSAARNGPNQQQIGAAGSYDKFRDPNSTNAYLNNNNQQNNNEMMGGGTYLNNNLLNNNKIPNNNSKPQDAFENGFFKGLGQYDRDKQERLRRQQEVLLKEMQQQQLQQQQQTFGNKFGGQPQYQQQLDDFNRRKINNQIQQPNQFYQDPNDAYPGQQQPQQKPVAYQGAPQYQLLQESQAPPPYQTQPQQRFAQNTTNAFDPYDQQQQQLFGQNNGIKRTGFFPPIQPQPQNGAGFGVGMDDMVDEKERKRREWLAELQKQAEIDKARKDQEKKEEKMLRLGLLDNDPPPPKQQQIFAQNNNVSQQPQQQQIFAQNNNAQQQQHEFDTKRVGPGAAAPPGGGMRNEFQPSEEPKKKDPFDFSKINSEPPLKPYQKHLMKRNQAQQEQQTQQESTSPQPPQPQQARSSSPPIPTLRKMQQPPAKENQEILESKNEEGEKQDEEIKIFMPKRTRNLEKRKTKTNPFNEEELEHQDSQVKIRSSPKNQAVTNKKMMMSSVDEEDKESEEQKFSMRPRRRHIPANSSLNSSKNEEIEAENDEKREDTAPVSRQRNTQQKMNNLSKRMVVDRPMSKNHEIEEEEELEVKRSPSPKIAAARKAKKNLPVESESNQSEEEEQEDTFEADYYEKKMERRKKVQRLMQDAAQLHNIVSKEIQQQLQDFKKSLVAHLKPGEQAGSPSSEEKETTENTRKSLKNENENLQASATKQKEPSASSNNNNNPKKAFPLLPHNDNENLMLQSLAGDSTMILPFASTIFPNPQQQIPIVRQPEIMVTSSTNQKKSPLSSIDLNNQISLKKVDQENNENINVNNTNSLKKSLNEPQQQTSASNSLKKTIESQNTHSFASPTPPNIPKPISQVQSFQRKFLERSKSGDEITSPQKDPNLLQKIEKNIPASSRVSHNKKFSIFPNDTDKDFDVETDMTSLASNLTEIDETNEKRERLLEMFENEKDEEKKQLIFQEYTRIAKKLLVNEPFAMEGRILITGKPSNSFTSINSSVEDGLEMNEMGKLVVDEDDDDKEVDEETRRARREKLIQEVEEKLVDDVSLDKLSPTNSFYSIAEVMRFQNQQKDVPYQGKNGDEGMVAGLNVGNTETEILSSVPFPAQSPRKPNEERPKPRSNLNSFAEMSLAGSAAFL